MRSFFNKYCHKSFLLSYIACKIIYKNEFFWTNEKYFLKYEKIDFNKSEDKNE